MSGSGWADLAQVRARLDAGADPNSGVYAFGGYDGRPLHFAAESGSPETVTEPAARVDGRRPRCGRPSSRTARTTPASWSRPGRPLAA
ncbi:hypothetical protein [Nonomuraea phyllanthi]|uniref:hypothetical protein n=1 Tax=Nonomuraea phyllanthi TaxID=2219224 RepID=UPI001265D005|nr:hypothetical protein [Nonomuraea phyllanthi]